MAPQDLTTLEAEAAQQPGNAAANLRLARAYYAADRYDDARRVLAAALTADSTSAEARAYLGLTYEALAQYDSARAVYTSLLASKVDGRVRRLLAGRLALLTRKELQAAARDAIARESLLVRTPPDPNTVAVLPFRYSGTDTTFRPLERGLAAVMVTDLSQVRRLKLVERARVQALLNELRLAESGRVDPATGARSGRLVGAGEVLQGQFATGGGAEFRLDATIVRAADAQVAASGSNADRLRALFDVEKAVVFQLLDRLGITLTPAERVAISERPTHDLQAFLLYSRGLEAEDRGDFAAAAQVFQQAARIDPAFRAAAQQAAATQAAQAAAAGPATDLATAVSSSGGGIAPGGGPTSGTLLTAINGAVPSSAVVLTAVSATSEIVLPPSDPNRICEDATCDGPARASLIGSVILVIKKP